ncbi:MAG: oligoendopeptidase F [Candidatus Zixiibacteriota bacterium]
MNSREFKRSLSILFSILFVLALYLPALAQVDEAPTRDQIEDKYKWDLTEYFASDEDWEASMTEVEAMIPKMNEFKGKLGSSAETMIECFKLNDTIGMLIHRLWVYSGLKRDEDNRVGKYQEMAKRAFSTYSVAGEVTAYIEPELLTIPKEKIDAFMKENAELAVYKHYFSDLFRRQEHVLSEAEERILALAGRVTSGPSDIFTMLDDADITFGTTIDEDGNEIELTRGRYSRLLESKNRDVRRQASETYNDAYKGYINVLGATLNASVQKDWFLTQARGYNSCLEASLDGNNIPTDVFHNIIKSANNNLSALHKYTKIRKEALGVDTLFGFDMSVPLVENIQTDYAYDDAAKMTVGALAPLGKEYQKRLQMAIDSRWIDVYETQGKGSGGYNWGSYLGHPVILMNWANSLDNVFTLAHELGHALHMYYTNENEPYTYTGHSLFAAEVASTCNEALMIHYMLDKANTKEEKLYILDHYINMFIGTFFVQLFFSEYELNIHDAVEQGGQLSSETLRKFYRDVYEKYYGPDYFIPEGRDLGGLRIGHFYRQYYVYQYATSFAASQMLAQRILDKEPGAKEAYMEFIKVGTSDYPINILKNAGIDFTTTEPFDYTMKIFSDLVDQYETLLLEK